MLPCPLVARNLFDLDGRVAVVVGVLTEHGMPTWDPPAWARVVHIDE